MTYNPIPDLVQLGYTWREAAFLYVVGRNSGFFLGRQYNRFFERKPGALVQQLVQRAERFGHITTLDYGQRRHIYHLKSRTVYRLLGEEESQNRRAKGDHKIKSRLMVLDYILQHLPAVSLAGEQEKCTFFVQTLGLKREQLPLGAPPSRSHSTARHFIDCFPIYAPLDGSQSSESIRFTYFDHGTSTIKPFLRHLQTYTRLFESLGSFELRYIAVSPRNFTAAETAFGRAFPTTPMESRLLPYGLDHLIQFCKSWQLWDSNSPKFTPEHLHILRNGEQVYIEAEHEELYSAWLTGRADFDRALIRFCGKSTVNGRFSTFLLTASYPIFGFRYHGKPVKSTAKPPIKANSELCSIAS